MTSRVDPVAVRRGQTVEIGISGTQNWNGAWGLLCEPPGLRGEVLKSRDNSDPPRPRPAPAAGDGEGRRLWSGAKLEVGADCPLGPREIRVATPQGASSVGLVVVVDDPVVIEADDLANDTPATAQKLSLPAVVSGRIGKLEDVDWYAFEAEKGQRSHVRGLGKSPGKQDPRPADAPRPDSEPARPDWPRAGRGRQHALRRSVAVVQVAGERYVLSSGPRYDLYGRPGMVVRASRA